MTVGGPNSATVGMRMMGLVMRTWYGGKVTPLVAAFHALLFWFSLVIFCPILLWALFDSRKRCLHDILAGVVLINRTARLEAFQAAVKRDFPPLLPHLRSASDPLKLGGKANRIRARWHVTEHKSNFPEFYITAPQPCPYLPGRLERKLFTHLTRDKPHFLIDNLLKGGFRRSQNIAYMPYCDACSACVPVRILVDEFTHTRSLKRIVRANGDLVATRKDPAPNAEQYALFRGYIDARHADGGMAEMSVLDYSLMVEDSVVETFVTEYRVKPRPGGNGEAPLLGVSLCDRLSDGISMVYSFYDPDYAGPQPRHLYDPRPGGVRAPAWTALRLSRLLDRGLAQDALQEPLPAAGAPHVEGLGADGGSGRGSEARRRKA